MNTLAEIPLRKLILLGGPMMLPLMICSVFALTTIIEKLIYFHNILKPIAKVKETVFDLIQKNKIPEAISFCDTHPSLAAKILKSGLIKFGSTKEEMKKSMEEAGLFEIPKIEHHLGILSTTAHISPLLGFLATAIGMFSCFHTVQVRFASLMPITPADFTAGLGQALIATIAGLAIAIVSFIAYNYFISRAHYIVFEIERMSVELINFIYQMTDNEYLA